MARKSLWNRGRVLEEIAREAQRNNGVAVSSNVSSRMRQCAIEEYGSWAKACMAAGVMCPSLGKRKLNSVNSLDDWHQADVSAGVPVNEEGGTICFDCARSGAPISLRCSWDADLVLPHGAVYCKKYLKISNGEIITMPIVLACPLFVDNKDANFMKLIKLERRRVMLENMGDKMGSVNEFMKIFEED